MSGGLQIHGSSPIGWSTFIWTRRTRLEPIARIPSRAPFLSFIALLVFANITITTCCYKDVKFVTCDVCVRVLDSEKPPLVHFDREFCDVLHIV
jgi:hypothetical protein